MAKPIQYCKVISLQLNKLKIKTESAKKEEQKENWMLEIEQVAI